MGILVDFPFNLTTMCFVGKEIFLKVEVFTTRAILTALANRWRLAGSHVNDAFFK